MMRQIIWLALVPLCGCVPLVANLYQPLGPGDIEPQHGGACSMAPSFQITQHLPSHVDIEVTALAKTPGVAHALITMSIRVPAGTTVRLTEPEITVREGPSAPAVRIKIDRIHKPRTIVNGQVSDYLEPGDLLIGPKGYGIDVELPHDNPAQIIVTLPPLDIDSQHVEVEPMEFVLKSRLHLTGIC
jgi:hypothetical protein